MASSSSKNRSNYLPTLDGWRAIAILWVMVGHGALWSVGRFSNSAIRATDVQGVQLFFALSGFLICTRLLREEQRYGSISLRSFYTRRLFRIQPAAMTYLLAVAILSICGILPHFWPGIAGAVLMIRNLWPTTYPPGGWNAFWYTSHFWSLAVEEHFYLLLPGFLLLIRRSRLAILLGVTVALQVWHIVVLRTPWLQSGPRFLLGQRTDMVMGGILLGSVFAIALTHENLRRLAVSLLRPWVALLYTAFVCIEIQRHHSTPTQMSLITVYPVLIVATVLHPNGFLGRFLELAPVRFIGRISYSLYLWQQLFLHGEARPDPHSFAAHTLLCWAASFACAIASYYLIETPVIRRGHRIAKRFDLQEMDHNRSLTPTAVAEA